MWQKYVSTLALLWIAAGCTGQVGNEWAPPSDFTGFAGAPALADEDVAVSEQDLTKTISDMPVQAILGSGYNSITDETLAQCVSSSLPYYKFPGDGILDFTATQSESKVSSLLKIGASGKASLGIVKGSARVAFSDAMRSSAQSVSLIYGNRAVTETRTLNQTKSGLSWNVKPTASDFFTRCGDMFVNENDMGGELYILIRIDFATEAEKQSFQANFSASFPLGSAKGNLESLKHVYAEHASVHVSAYQRGGAVGDLGSMLVGTNGAMKNDLPVVDCLFTDLTGCSRFLSNALTYAGDAFPKSLKANPAILSSDVQEWTVLGAGKAVQDVPAVIASARTNLLSRYGWVVRTLERVAVLENRNFFGGPAAFKANVLSIKSSALAARTAIEGYVTTCFDRLSTPPTAAQTKACTDAVFGEGRTSEHPIKVAARAGWLDELEIPMVPTTFPQGANDARRDFMSTVLPGAGNWGAWSDWKMCPAGTFATGFNMRVEPNRGTSDDSSLNTVRLDCQPWDRSSSKIITAHPGYWGTDGNYVHCTSGAMYGMRLLFEPSQGSNDDTGANNMRGYCLSGEDTLEPDNGRGFGDWGSPTYCQPGTAICGYQLRVEEQQGSGDDTAMNGIKLACCLY